MARVVVGVSKRAERTRVFTDIIRLAVRACVHANVCRLDKEANCAAAYSPNCEQTAETQQLTLKNETPKALKLKIKKAGGRGEK